MAPKGRKKGATLVRQRKVFKSGLIILWGEVRNFLGEKEEKEGGKKAMI